MRVTVRVFIVIVSTLGILSGCAGVIIKETSQANRDASQAYDGFWKVSITPGPSLQYVQNWNMTCNMASHNFTIRVDDGKIISYRKNAKTLGYISEKGTFRVYPDSDFSSSRSPTASLNMSRTGDRLVFEGVLGETEGTGRWILGRKALGLQGCTSKVTFTKSH